MIAGFKIAMSPNYMFQTPDISVLLFGFYNLDALFVLRWVGGQEVVLSARRLLKRTSLLDVFADFLSIRLCLPWQRVTWTRSALSLSRSAVWLAHWPCVHMCLRVGVFTYAVDF